MSLPPSNQSDIARHHSSACSTCARIAMCFSTRAYATREVEHAMSQCQQISATVNSRAKWEESLGFYPQIAKKRRRPGKLKVFAGIDKALTRLQLVQLSNSLIELLQRRARNQLSGTTAVGGKCNPRLAIDNHFTRSAIGEAIMANHTDGLTGDRECSSGRENIMGTN
jgi:hypothetical protein